MCSFTYTDIFKADCFGNLEITFQRMKRFYLHCITVFYFYQNEMPSQLVESSEKRGGKYSTRVCSIDRYLSIHVLVTK